MNETYRCPKCGQSVPPDAPEGLCPRCLGALNLDSDSGLTGSPAAAAPPPPSASELAPHFPHLEILEVIGHGGMGVVYKVRQKQLDRVAALKLLPPGLGADPAFAERFAREAKALARLNHPGIVTIYDFGRADGLFFLLMEFVDGVSLGRLLRAGRVSPREALAIVPQLCDALQYAHDQGIVHRDIKPENILLDRLGRVKVADFGLAKLVGTSALTPARSLPAGEQGASSAGQETPPPANFTEAGKVMGTPQYMAPEQAEHPATVDHRADIYALGVVFYQMLTGELPGKRLEPPSKKVQIDVRLDEVVLRALEQEPARRYQQVSEVKTAVETIARTSRPAAVAPPTRNRRINWLPALVLYSLQAALVVPLERSLLHGDWNRFLFWLLLSFLALVSAYIAWGRLHYLCWQALPEKFRATTPGQAVGFLFIPFFNFYWGFISFPKLAGGFNALQAEHPQPGVRDMKALGVAKAILFVCVWTVAFIPGWNAPICLADLLVFVLFYRGIVANANRFATLPRPPEKEPVHPCQPASQPKTAVETTVQTTAPEAPRRDPGLELSATPSNAPTRPRASRRRRYAYVGGAAGIVALLALWFCLHLWLRSPGPPAALLTQYQFQQLVDSNQIAQATIHYDPRNPILSEITGRYYATDPEGKRLPENNPHAKIPFRAKIRLYPKLEARLLSLPQFQPQEGTPKTGLLSPPQLQPQGGTPNLPLPKLVSATTARKGDIAVRLNSLGTVESSNSVFFAIPEDYCQGVIRKFTAHQALTVEAYDRTGQKRFGHGSLTGVDNRIDTATATLTCRASLSPEGDNLMVPGLFLNIHLLLEVKHDVTLVPLEAIQHDAQSAFVWVIQSNHTVTLLRVEVGAIDGKRAEIHSGVETGQVVVTDGAFNLREGQEVRYYHHLGETEPARN